MTVSLRLLSFPSLLTSLLVHLSCGHPRFLCLVLCLHLVVVSILARHQSSCQTELQHPFLCTIVFLQFF